MTWMADLLSFVLHSSGVEHSPQRRKLNFVGAQLTDDATNEWTTVYIGNTNDWKGSVRFATTQDMSATRTGNVLTASGNGNINTLGGIDGGTVVLDDLVLFKDEAAAADNGIWRFTDLGSPSTPWTAQRATLADESVEVTPGLTTYVEEGYYNAQTVYQLITTGITLNTTALVFRRLDDSDFQEINWSFSPYTAIVAKRRIVVNLTSASPVTIYLPPAAAWKGTSFWVKDMDNAGLNSITIDASGSEQIDFAATYVINVRRRGVELYSDGTRIWVMNRWT